MKMFALIYVGIVLIVIGVLIVFDGTVFAALKGKTETQYAVG